MDGLECVWWCIEKGGGKELPGESAEGLGDGTKLLHECLEISVEMEEGRVRHGEGVRVDRTAGSQAGRRRHGRIHRHRTGSEVPNKLQVF